jgi:hypothetical protein
VSLSVPTRNQIATQVEAILAREPDARCIAIRSPAPEAWPDTLALRNRAFSVRWCESPLAARQYISETETGGREGVVLLTSLGERELGSDVIARLSRGRVFQIESWDMVREVFQAREVDSRLANQNWMASLLLENLPPGGYAPVPGGVLDLDTAWSQILRSSLGLETGRPDVLTLLRWTMNTELVARYAGLPETSKQQISQWISETSGPVGELVMRCVDAGNGFDSLPIGLACGVIFSSASEPQPELAAAAVRLERYTGDRRIRDEEGKRWADAATWVARNSDRELVRPYVARADGLLHELHLIGFAGLSDVLPSGFEARLSGVAGSISSFLKEGTVASLAGVERSVDLAMAHDVAKSSPGRQERAVMALRLCRWLTTRSETPASFAALAHAYAHDGAFVDWARLKLLGGDELALLSAAYKSLAAAVRDRREKFNGLFAESLKIWNAEGSPTIGCIPVERVLEETVEPLARQSHVLLLVLDGLSFPIFRELFGDLQRLGWAESIPISSSKAVIAIAAIPTVTEISRTSLLCGRLASGAANVEKSGFSSYPALLGASKAAGKPIVFHKGELGDAMGLSQEVREAVGKRDRRVVAVVYNAVDDHLSGSDQLHLRWSLDDLRLLRPLLYEAQMAERALVITADHGHMIDEQTVQRSGTDGDRWRTYSGTVGEGEIVLEGGRVRTPSGANNVVCAWSELLRYSSKKNGYHGGVSPQEVVIPLNVFLPPRIEIEGWRAAAPEQPDWWERVILAAAKPPELVPPVDVKPRKATAKGQAELFEGIMPRAKPDWITMLLETSTYQQQKQLAARVAPKDEDIRRLLEALDGRGGKMSKTALAQRIDLPLMRLSGFINAARRVLNVDQSGILSLDENNAMVELNRELLEIQFQLKSL